MMDQQLTAQGLSLDDLMRELYKEFVSDGVRYTPASVQATLERITGKDWTTFFQDYVYGTKYLQIDGPFVYLRH